MNVACWFASTLQSAPVDIAATPSVIATRATPTKLGLEREVAARTFDDADRLSEAERKLLLYWKLTPHLDGPALTAHASKSSEVTGTRAAARQLLVEARTLFEHPTPVYSAELYAAYCTGELQGPEALEARLQARSISAPVFAWWFHDPAARTRIIQGLWYFRCLSNLEAMQWALRRYADEHDGRFPERLTALVGPYLARLPRCPAAAPDARFTDGYRSTDDAKGYALRCSNHTALHSQPLVFTQEQASYNPTVSRELFAEFSGYIMVANGYNHPSRRHWATPILDALKLRAGEAVADVGCGVGQFTFVLAQKVAGRGRVYAVDVERGVLNSVAFQARVQRFANVQTVCSVPTDVTLPESALDAALMNDVYRYLMRPDHPEDYAQRVYPLLRSIRRSLRTSGRLAISDQFGLWGRFDLRRGVPPEESVREQVERAGFSLTSRAVYGERSERFVMVFHKR